MKKKVLLIIIPIILVIAIVGIILTVILLNNNKSVGTAWGDTYFEYLVTAVGEESSSKAEEKYGMKKDMNDAKIQFIEIEESKNPSMVLSYTYEDKNYLNIYHTEKNNKVKFSEYKKADLGLYYNINSSKYVWYVHQNIDDEDLYTSLDKIVKTEDDDNINYDYKYKAEDNTEFETISGETLKVTKAEQTIVITDVEGSAKSNFDKKIKKGALKKAITEAVEGYKKNEKFVTDDVKNFVENKRNETKKMLENIEKAKDEKSKKELEESKLTNENFKDKIGENLKWFVAGYSGDTYGLREVYKYKDVSKTVKIPGLNGETAYNLCELEGAKSIADIKAGMEEHVSKDVISKWKGFTTELVEYDGKVYWHSGGIGSGPEIDIEKAKVISSENGKSVVELQEYDSIIDYITPIKVTIEFKDSKYLVTGYTTEEPRSAYDNTQTAPTTPNTSNPAPATGLTNGTPAGNSDKPTMANAISLEEAQKLAEKKWGTVSEETGNPIGYGYEGWMKDSSGMQYYMFSMRWIVDGHSSFLATVCVSADGKKWGLYTRPTSYDNGATGDPFEQSGNF